jgi:subtilisin family serine protease
LPQPSSVGGEEEATVLSKVTVGVVDTGIDYAHPDLRERVGDGYDFVNDDNDAMDDQ